jgi:hypothetical protein
VFSAFASRCLTLSWYRSTISNGTGRLEAALPFLGSLSIWFTFASAAGTKNGFVPGCESKTKAVEAFVTALLSPFTKKLMGS